jgi:hypothetical protein
MTTLFVVIPTLRVVISSPTPPPVVAKVVGTSVVAQTQAADPTRVSVQVFDDYDNTKTGRGVIALGKKKQLKIVEHSPWEIWPLLPPQINKDGSKESRGADQKGYRPKRTVVIGVKDGSGEPLVNEGVELGTRFHEKSGNHQHNSADVQMPDGIKQGIFYGQGMSGNPIYLTTDQSGVAVVDSFVASQISGDFLITASLVSDTTVKDTVNLEVKVPRLVNFRNLIVLEEKPFVFFQTPKGESNHPSPNNTWCTAQMGDSLYLGILDFYEWSRTKKGGGTAIQTSINDMSLPFGGLFDIEGDWKTDHPSHSFHRVGLSVDINRNHMSNSKLAKLTYYLGLHGGKRYREDQIHYGFVGGN